MIDRKIMIEEFSKKAQLNKAAFFIGAGISVPYGLPDFYQLIREMAEGKIDLDIETRHNYPEIAQYILNACANDKTKILQEIRARFNIKYDKKLSTYLDSISKSTITTIWTTNYDTLIEQSLDDCEKKYITKNKDEIFQREFENYGKTEVLKIHGDINSNDVIITKNDYEDFNISHKVTIRRLENDLMTKSLLFIGYSYTDANIQNIVNNVRQLTEGKADNNHYMILSKAEKGNDAKLQKLWIRDLERYGIQVYILEDGFNELKDILKQISLKSKGNSVFVTGSHYDNNNIVAKGLGKRLCEIKDLQFKYGQSEGISKTVCNQYARTCISQGLPLANRIQVYPNPYSFCKDWDNRNFLLEELKELRSELISKTQVMIAFPGGKGTMAEIKIGLKKGTIIVPVFQNGRDDFKEEILKKTEILNLLQEIDAEYFDKLMKNKIKADDIINCLKKIFK